MSHDEVVRGTDPDEPSRSYGWFLIVGVAVVAAGISILGHHGKTASPAPKPLPSLSAFPTPSAAPSATPSASATPSSVIFLDARNGEPVTGFVDASDICKPVTNGRTTLTVSFVIHNPTTKRESLIAIKPDLPLAGLTGRGTTLRSGTCAHPGTKPLPVAAHVLAAGGTALITMTYGLPTTCPQPLPVLADVTLNTSAPKTRQTQELRLFNDLGALKFATCPARSTS